MKTAKTASVLACLLSLPAFVLGQTATTAHIAGVVEDPTGAVVARAEVELVNKTTKVRQTVQTDAVGQYVFPHVPPGVYELRVRMVGFRTSIISDFKVEVAKSYTVDFTLELGAVDQVVEVAAETRIELQTTDSQIGSVVGGEPILRLPSFQRSAGEFFDLSPGVIPRAGTDGGANSGGAVTGARSDQSTFSLDGIDISDNVVGGGADLTTAIPVPIDSVREFRVGVANPNATFGRSAGAQVSMIGRRGSNNFHGAAYWYHQNDNLNANTWTNNSRNIDEAELKDNRYGFRVGGPIWPDRAFFFVNYEARDFPTVRNGTRFVPSDTLRQGILRFQDAAGNIVSYDLAGATGCDDPATPGPDNLLPCDPRGLGISPTVAALWSSLPAGNDPTALPADLLNTIGFSDTVSTPIETRYIVGRFDFNFTDKWRLNTSYTYYRSLSDSASQLDITSGRARAVRTSAARPRTLTASVVGQITPTLTSNFHFGWVRNRFAAVASRPRDTAATLAVPGTQTSVGFVALDAGRLDEPIDVNFRALAPRTSADAYQFIENVTWLKGKHTMLFGGNMRYMPLIHDQNNKIVPLLTSLVASLDDARFISIPASARPPTCGAAVSTNCINPSDVTRWNDLYAAALGMVDNVSVLAVFDGDLNPLPLGTSLVADTELYAYEFYAQDTWRVTPSFTLTFGLTYQWQTPPKEKLGRQTFIINNETGEIINAQSFLERKRQAVLAGQAFNPELAYLPINSSDRKHVFDIDWNNWGPRVAAAWHPSFQDGFLSTLFGNRKTVLRGGFGVLYDRLNGVQNVVIPSLGVGFTQTLSVNGPNCDASGTSGPGCDPAGADPSSAFRVGQDGAIPVPTAMPLSIPVVPPPLFSELFSFQVDPDFEVGKNYTANFTVQRELPGNMLLEVGWAGRWGRQLNQSRNLNAVPFFHVDTLSGQSFAQAFDAVATELRTGVPPVSVTPQPWFENQVFPGGTRFMASIFTGEFVDGLLTEMWFFGLDFFGPNLSNLQVLELFMRGDGGESNYHGLLVSLHKRPSHGLNFSLNYTLSKSLDQVGAVQNSASYFPNPYDPNTDYGVSFFDRTHVFNALWLYDLPFGRGRYFSAGNWADKLIAGWYVSGIFTAYSGLPDIVVQSDQVFGGGFNLAFDTGAIPTVDPDSFGNSTHSGVTGSGGVGTRGDPLFGGSGINRFANPEAVFNSFRHVLISQDGRTGRANPLRAFPRWNLDFSLGKRTSVRERVSILFSFDFFNIFNHVNFNSGSTSLQRPDLFGVVTSQFAPSNRRGFGSRWIQFGFRVEF